MMAYIVLAVNLIYTLSIERFIEFRFVPGSPSQKFVMVGERFVVTFQKYSVFFILLEVDFTYFFKT